MKLSVNIIAAGCGVSLDIASKVISEIQKACDKFNIESQNSVAAFLANIGVESANLTTMSENLNYSAEGLVRVWPYQFAENPHSDHRVPGPFAMSYAHQPEKIANHVYANKNGNGPEASGDGWKYRGGGFIQLTGKGNYDDFSLDMGVDCVAEPELLRELEGAAMSAAWYFSKHGCIEKADADDFNSVVKAINGQDPCDANSGPMRFKLYKNALFAINAETKPSKPGKTVPQDT